MRTATYVACCVFTTCLAAVSADAASGEGEIGVDVGFAGLDDELGGDGSLLSFRVGYHATDTLEVEVQATVVSTECSVGICSDINLYYLNLVYNFNPSPVADPYLLLGVGYTDLEYTPTVTPVFSLEDSTSGDIVYQVAFGSRFFFGEKKKVALRAELSGTFLPDFQHANAQIGLLWKLSKR